MLSWCVSIQATDQMTAANSPVAAANRPQPSDPQKPHGASSARVSRDGACGALTVGRSKVAFTMDMAAVPKIENGAPLSAPSSTEGPGGDGERRNSRVTLDRQTDDDQRGEEHQDPDVEGEAECWVG